MRTYFSVVLVGSLVLVGCGNDDKHGGLPDGPLAAIDAPIDVPGELPPPVTLTVLKNGKPQTGVHTYFLNADSSVVATLDTDASGTVTAVMAAGGSVTAIDPFPPVVVGDNDLRTFMAVKPGDQLLLTQNDAMTPIGFTLIAPVFGQRTDTSYSVLTSCGSGSISPGGGGSGSGSPTPGGPVSLTNCNGHADILIIATEPQSEGPPNVGALFHGNVTLTQDQIVDLSDDSYQPVNTVSFSYTNLPQATDSVSVFHSLATANGALPAFRPDSNGVAVVDGAASVDIPEPTIADATGVVDTEVVLRGTHHVIDKTSVATTYSLDGTGLLLRDLVDAPVYIQATRQLSWTEDTAGATPDLTVTCINVSTTAERRWSWAIAAPYTPTGELIFPTLPTDVADWTPAPNDFVTAQGLMNAKVPGGYDAVRAHVLDAVVAADLASAAGRTVTVDTQFGRCGQPLARGSRLAAPRR
jgi:hypothetical protein